MTGDSRRAFIAVTNDHGTSTSVATVKYIVFERQKKFQKCDSTFVNVQSGWSPGMIRFMNT